MNFFSNMRLPVKFLLLGIFVCLSILIPTKFFYDTEKKLVDVAKHELNGIEPSTRVILLIRKVQEFRSLTSLYLNQQNMDSQTLSSKGVEVLADFNQAESLFKNTYPDSQMLVHFVNAKAQFIDVITKVETRTILPSDAFNQQTDVVVELMTEVIPNIMEESGLRYDSVASSSHLIIATNQNLPLLVEGLARLRDLGTMALTRGVTERNQLASIKSLESFLESPQRDLVHNFESASESVDRQALKALFAKASSIESNLRHLQQLVNQEILTKDVTSYDPNVFFDESSSLINELYDLGRSSNQVLSIVMRERINNANQAVLTNLSIISGFILLLLIMSVGVIRSLNKGLNAVSHAVASVSRGDFSVQLNTTRKDEFGGINQGLINMSKSLSKARDDREKIQGEIEARLIETTRIEEALNATTTNVMITDNNRNIIYTNRSVQVMLTYAEAALCKVIPHFSANKLVGTNIDVFYKSGSQQGHDQEKANHTNETQLLLGTLHFRLVENPIYSQSGERIGAIFELLDRTTEVAAENEIAKVVKEASRGNFSMRVKVEKKEGFMKFMSESLNQLVETADYGLTDIGRVLMSLSQGNLTEKIVADYEGQFDYLKRYCNDTSENLASMIGQIRTAAETINIASAEIAQGNANLSSRTENQSSRLQQTASSMTQMTGTVQLNADNANQANLLASEASEVALEGGRLIGRVVETMESINQSSQKISDIIGVIDGIAFQTNILALNAAVEAARAGEQGRGFAVVASEVRSLAQRSATAAKDIKSLISDSVSKIEDGNRLVGQSGQTMDRIVESIKRVSGIMGDIASASAEQSSGVQEINKAISDMDEMTQQNAALVEESAAAAESMKVQASHLEEQVSTFVLSKMGPKPTVSVPTPITLPVSPAARSSFNNTSVSKTSVVKSTQIKNAQSSPVSAKSTSAPKTATKVVKPVKNTLSKLPVLDDDWEEF